MKIDELDKILKPVAPIHGVNSDGVISFKDEATPEQRAAAQNLVDTYIGQLDNSL